MLYSGVGVRETLYSFLVALGSGALEPVSGFAEVDLRACSVHVTHAKAEHDSPARKRSVPGSGDDVA